MDASIYYQTDAEYYRKLTQISFIRLFKRGSCTRGTSYQLVHEVRHSARRRRSGIRAKEDEAQLHHLPRERIRTRDTDRTRDPSCSPQCLSSPCTLTTRRRRLVGKELVTPVYGRKVKVIADPKVDATFGKGP